MARKQNLDDYLENSVEEINNIEKAIESDGIIEENDGHEKDEPSCLESLLHKVPCVDDPIIGTPKAVQKYLDKIALKVQKKPHAKNSDELFNKIHLYMHGYLINVAVKQFPYIKGLQTIDIYQESLIALRFKAIPGFNKEKGMSFLNFAKMCIRRHLITILNTSKTRKKDQSMNLAISIDAPLSDDEGNTVSNTIEDKSLTFNKVSERKEAYEFTKVYLMNSLSDFEKEVLTEYLCNSSYKEIARNISVKTNKKCDPKTVDNALLRIRKKAVSLRENEDGHDLPLFM